MESLPVWSAHPRWPALVLGATLSIGPVQARCESADGAAAVMHVRPGPPAGFVEIPDDGRREQPVSIEPAAPAVIPAPPRPAATAGSVTRLETAAARPGPVPTPMPVAARRPLPVAASRPLPVAARRPLPVDPMIDGQAPPLAVVISFSDRPGGKLEADTLAQTLRGLGVSVDEAPIHGAPLRAARIGYVFAPDRPAALAISVNAGQRYGFVDPVSMPSKAVPGARPGLIAIMLPG